MTGKLEEVEVVQGRAREVVLEGGTRINANAVVLPLGPGNCRRLVPCLGCLG